MALSKEEELQVKFLLCSGFFSRKNLSLVLLDVLTFSRFNILCRILLFFLFTGVSQIMANRDVYLSPSAIFWVNCFSLLLDQSIRLILNRCFISVFLLFFSISINWSCSTTGPCSCCHCMSSSQCRCPTNRMRMRKSMENWFQFQSHDLMNYLECSTGDPKVLELCSATHQIIPRAGTICMLSPFPVFQHYQQPPSGVVWCGVVWCGVV